MTLNLHLHIIYLLRNAEQGKSCAEGARDASKDYANGMFGQAVYGTMNAIGAGAAAQIKADQRAADEAAKAAQANNNAPTDKKNQAPKGGSAGASVKSGILRNKDGTLATIDMSQVTLEDLRSLTKDDIRNLSLEQRQELCAKQISSIQLVSADRDYAIKFIHDVQERFGLNNVSPDELFASVVKDVTNGVKNLPSDLKNGLEEMGHTIKNGIHEYTGSLQKLLNGIEGTKDVADAAKTGAEHGGIPTGHAGKVLGPLGYVSDAVDVTHIVTSDDTNKQQQLTEKGSSSLGGYIGGAVGGFVGGFIGSIAGTPGMVVGGAIGYYFGNALGRTYLSPIIENKINQGLNVDPSKEDKDKVGIP